MFDTINAQVESAGLLNPLSAIRERIGVILVGLLIFSSLLAIAGFVASYDARRKTAAFESDGQSVVGTIASTDAPGVVGGQVYPIGVCFRMRNSGYHCGKIDVPKGIYESARLGSPLKVTYVPWHPDWFYVADEVPDDSDSAIFARMFQYCMVASLLLVIAIAVMVFWQTGNGMAGHNPSGSGAGDVAVRFRRQQQGLKRRWRG